MLQKSIWSKLFPAANSLLERNKVSTMRTKEKLTVRLSHWWTTTNNKNDADGDKKLWRTSFFFPSFLFRYYFLYTS
jgi:hypothetical protein